MKRPDLEMIRRIKSRGLSDLARRSTCRSFMSYQPMQEFEFHANSTVDGIEDRNVKLDDGREVFNALRSRRVGVRRFRDVCSTENLGY